MVLIPLFSCFFFFPLEAFRATRVLVEERFQVIQFAINLPRPGFAVGCATLRGRAQEAGVGSCRFSVCCRGHFLHLFFQCSKVVQPRQQACLACLSRKIFFVRFFLRRHNLLSVFSPSLPVFFFCPFTFWGFSTFCTKTGWINQTSIPLRPNRRTGRNQVKDAQEEGDSKQARESLWRSDGRSSSPQDGHAL